MTNTKNGDAGRQGFTLLVVLLTILAIAAILTPLALGAKTRAFHAASLLRSDQLDFLADGIATILASQHVAGLDNRADSGIAMDSTLYRCWTDGLSIDYALQRHDGLINLNLASRDLLDSGFRSLGLGSETAQNIAETVIAFRTDDTDARPGSGLTVGGGLKKAPFETVSELYDIRPLGNIELQKLNRTFTVNSQSSGISSAHAASHLRNRIEGTFDSVSVSDPNVSDGTGAVTVHVSVTDGKSSGQFNAIFDAGGRMGRKPVILASWRYDLPAAPDTTQDEGRCRNRFGPAFESTISAMR